MILRGLGIGSMVYGLGYGFSRPDFSSAEVDIAPDGSVTIWNGASELGQGLRTALCQIAAEELGVPYEHTFIISSDTGSTPDAGPVSASRSIYVQGRAVILACQHLVSQLKTVAADLLNGQVGNVTFSSGIFLDDRMNKVSIERVAEECHKRGLIFRGFGWVNNYTSDVDPETSQGDAYSSYAWASQLIEVEVDTETGQVKVLRIASATDAGKVINPIGAEGQIEGGAVQGLGFAIMEHMIVKEGKNTNTGFSTYLIPTAADVPPIDSLTVEVYDPNGPFGAKGIAEPATIATIPAIINAISRAIGVRIHQTPATAERVLMALGKLPEKESLPTIDEIPFPPI